MASVSEPGRSRRSVACQPAAPGRLRVAVAGSGIAALELVLGLNALADEGVAVTLVAPEAHFTYQPPGHGRQLTLGHTER